MSLICQERNTKYEYLRLLVEWWNLIRRDYKFNVITPIIEIVKYLSLTTDNIMDFYDN